MFPSYVFNYCNQITELRRILNYGTNSWLRKKGIEVIKVNHEYTALSKVHGEAFNHWNRVANNLMFSRKKMIGDHTYQEVCLPMPIPREARYSVSFNNPPGKTCKLIEWIDGEMIHLFFRNNSVVCYDQLGKIKNSFPDDTFFPEKVKNLSMTVIRKGVQDYLYYAVRPSDRMVFDQTELNGLASDLGFNRPNSWENFGDILRTADIEETNRVFNFLVYDSHGEYCFHTILSQYQKSGIRELNKDILIEIWQNDRHHSAMRYDKKTIDFYSEFDSYCKVLSRKILNLAFVHKDFEESETRQYLLEHPVWVRELVVELCRNLQFYNDDQMTEDNKHTITKNIKSAPSNVLVEMFEEHLNTSRYRGLIRGDLGGVGEPY